MAILRVNPSVAFDFRSLSYNWYAQNRIDSGIRHDEAAVIDGRYYPDAFFIVASFGGATRELIFAGSDITLDIWGRVTGGNIAAITEIDRTSGLPLYILTGLSLDAAALYATATSASSADELDLLRTALADADTLTLSERADYAEGAAGDDEIYGFGGRDELLGGDGNDALYGGDDRDILIGGDGGDFLFGGAGDDYQMIGGAGDDLLDGGAGSDTMFGGTGDDTYVVDSGPDTIFERADEGIDTVLSYSNFYTLPANVENLTIAVPRSASLTGNSLDNRIVGGIGTDRLDGEEGNDTLLGNSGIDTAIYWGVDRSAASVERVAGGPLRITSLLDGTDVASGVELVRFRDGLYSFEFGDPEGPSLAQFGGVTGGWSSQERFPRHLADVNGDGFADIVGFGQVGVLVSLGSSTGRFADQLLASTDFGHAAGWTSDVRFHRQLADVNGDGRADIVGFGLAGTLVALGTADGDFASPILAIFDYGTNQGWTDQDTFARTLGDVNGDGRADIVGFGSSGVLVSFGRADGGFQSPILALSDFNGARGWSSNDLFPRDVADVDRDGRADIVGFGTAGTYFAYAKEDGTFGTPIFVFREFGVDQGWTSQDRFARRVADVNGDGFADVVGFGEAGTYVAFGYDPTGYGIDESLKPAARLFAPAFDLKDFGRQQGWGSDNITHREIGDINNDGLLDIVGFGPSGLLISMNQGGLMSS